MNAVVSVPLRFPSRTPITGLERRLGIEAALAVVIPDRPPTRVGRFVVERRLGAGAMGVVYRAWDPELDRPVAMKITRGSSEVGRRCMLREARALARATHPNVVAVHEIGCHGDDFYVVMELVEGETMGAWSRRDDVRCVALLDVCIQAGRGLAAAHQSGVVHGDFKPGNVMVGDDGRVRVVDFGLAAIFDATEPRLANGCTPRYAAPEVLGDRSADARSDQYSYCRSILEIMSSCELLDVLRPALERGCAPRPEDRWPDMATLLDALLRSADPGPRIPDRRGSRGSPDPGPRRIPDGGSPDPLRAGG